MSGTDKDKPQYVTAAWYEPVHHQCAADRATPRYAWSSSVGRRECDLPTEPTISWPDANSWRAYRHAPRCHWAPVWDRHNTSHPPRDYIHVEWTGPDRAAARDACLTAKAEYRATGAVDVDPPTWQHRHAAHWNYN